MPSRSHSSRLSCCKSADAGEDHLKPGQRLFQFWQNAQQQLVVFARNKLGHINQDESVSGQVQLLPDLPLLITVHGAKTLKADADAVDFFDPSRPEMAVDGAGIILFVHGDQAVGAPRQPFFYRIEKEPVEFWRAAVKVEAVRGVQHAGSLFRALEAPGA